MNVSRRYKVLLWRENHIKFVIWVMFFVLLFATIVVNSSLLLSQSIRLDEAQSLWAATKPVPAILDFLSQDVTMPLYALVLHFWITIFSPSVISLRLLSLLFFLLTLPVLYALVREVSTRKVALLTVLLFSLSPFIMWYTFEGRMYTLLTLLSSLSSLSFIRLLKTNTRSGKLEYIMSSVLGLYTHYFFVFILITQALYMFFHWLQHANSSSPERPFVTRLWEQRTFPMRFFLLIGVTLASLIPWAIYVIMQGTIVNTEPLIPPPTGFSIFQTFTNFLFGFQASEIQSIIISLWPAFIVLLFVVFTQKRRMNLQFFDYFVFMTFLPILIVFIGSIFRPIFLSRYLITVTPTLFFLFAWMLINNSARLTSILIASAIVTMGFFLFTQNISAQTPVKENYSGVARYLEQHAKPSDIIAISAPFTIYPLAYNYHGTNRIDTIPQWNQYSHGPMPPFSHAALAKQIATYTSTYTRLYVVLSYDQGYEKSIKQYLDTHYQRNDLKEFSPGLEVRAYQLKYK